PIVAPLYNWTGPYIGIAGGYGWGHSDQTDPGRPPNAGNGSYSLTGGILGGTLGYNWQQGPWVLGSLALKATIRGPISAAVPIRADWPLLSLPIPAAARLNPLAPAWAHWLRHGRYWQLAPLCDWRTRGRRGQCLGFIIVAVRQRFSRGLDRWRRRRSRHHAELDGQDRIPLCRSW